jgi:hypothetical protein
VTATAKVGLQVRILHVAACPLLGQARALVDTALKRSGLHATVEEIEGPYPSPSVLVNGKDATGREPREAAACRLDLPSEDQILAALNNARSG